MRYPTRSACSGGGFDPGRAAARLAELDAEAAAPGFWSDAARAARAGRERSALEGGLAALAGIESERDDALALLEVAGEDGDAGAVAEAEAMLGACAARARRAALEAMLPGEDDAGDCFLEVNAGAGGLEAQDWAEMLARMYRRWAERRGMATETIDERPGEEAGLRSVAMRVSGPYACGWLRPESGVHRMVRISRYDAQKRRHTAFSSVWVVPVVDDSVDVEVRDQDLRIDTYRASGAGGQHVNRTESAVRITHLPTGVVAQCQSDRSQHRNRATAMQMLRAKLHAAEMTRRAEAAAAVNEGKSDISWGHQIRSYVFQPYRMVKDHRTGEETGRIEAVMDGELDGFLEAALAARAAARAGS